MLSGNTVFVGDSITVGLPPFVQVDGTKTSIAKGGRSTAQILAASKAPEALPLLSAARNMVVLGGTNDIAGGLSPDAIFGNLTAIWQIAKDKGLRIVAITIPPVRGYAGFPNPQAAEGKRQAVNAKIKASLVPDVVLDSDVLMGDGQAFPALLMKFDSGDHLHPRKDAMGAAMNTELAKPAAAAATIPAITPGTGIPAKTGGITPTEVVVGGVVSWGLWRFARSKGWL